MNALPEEQVVTIHGAVFTFKPLQIKNMTESKAHFLCTDRREEGFVGLPDSIDDPDFKSSPEGKALIEAKRKEGVENHVAKLRQVIYNMQVSLRQDLEKANIKADPRVFASEGEIAAMERLAKYQVKKEDSEQKKIDRIKELEKAIKE